MAKVLDISEIREGMKLAEDIVTSFGTKVAAAGTVVDGKILALLKTSRIHSAKIEYSEDESKDYEGVKKDLRDAMIANRNKTIFVSVSKVEEIVDSIMNYIIHDPCEAEYIDLLIRMRDYSETVFAHSVNVAMISFQYANWNNMEPQKCKELVLAALIHDIGKLQVPIGLLDATMKLTDAQFAKIKKHSIDGYMMLKNGNIPEIIKRPILDHHERCDGSGYPMGYYFSQISEYGRILGVMDSYEAMAAKRAYRDNMCPFQIVNVMTKDAASKYDAQVIENFFFNVLTTYIGGKVLLSNGYTVKLKALNKQAISYPVVEVGGKTIDLSMEQMRKNNIQVVKIVFE